MLRIKQEALALEKALAELSHDQQEVSRIIGELEKLQDRFYEENKEFVPLQQFNGAKKDFEYFMRLIVVAVAYYEEHENSN